MALSMTHINEVLRQFATTVIVEMKDWPVLLTALKLDASKPIPVLDRMTLVPIAGGYQELAAQLSRLLSENDQLTAKVTELESKMAVADARKVQST